MSDKLKNPEDYSLDKGYMSLHEILAVNGIKQRMLIEELNKEEIVENSSETIDDIKSDIEFNKQRTQIAKEKFISDIRGSLGKEIMENPNGVKIIKKPWYVKLKNFLKILFTRF